MPDFAQSENERMIRDSVGAIAPPDGDLKRIRNLRFTVPGCDRSLWQKMAEMGWLAICLPEEKGGLGLGMREFCAVAEELGAALVPEPILAAAAIVPALPAEMAGQVLSGERIILPAWQETKGQFGSAARTRCDPQLNGGKILIPYGLFADAYLVTTVQGLALVKSDAAGVSQTHHITQDGGHFVSLEFADASSDVMAGDLTDALEHLALAHSAYLFGAAQRAFLISLDYLKIRKQFGRFIGSFQSLQHRVADLKIQLEISRAVLSEAMAAVDGNMSVEARQKTISRAKARVADTALLIARESIQYHGAIGIADEYDIGLFCRKILTQYNLYGSSAWHRSRFLELENTFGEEAR